MAQQATRTFRWLEGEKAMGQRQDDMEVLDGLDLKVLGDTRKSPQ